MDEKALRRWNQLFNFYLNDPSMPEEWYAEVQRLFADEIFEEEKFAALEKYFDKMVRYDQNPDSETLRRLDKITADLGFPGQDDPRYVAMGTDVPRIVVTEDRSRHQADAAGKSGRKQIYFAPKKGWSLRRSLVIVASAAALLLALLSL